MTADRLRIAWFSPLPPMGTGVAENVVPVLEELRPLADVTLWTTESNAGKSLGFPRVRYDPGPADWAALNESDIAICHIGNNHTFHREIWRIAQAHSSIVVLHDEALQHLFAAMVRELGSTSFLRTMARTYGEAGLLGARKYLAQELPTLQLAERFPLTRAAVDGACGVVVHSRTLGERLAREHSCPIAYLPLPHRATNPDPRRSPVDRPQGDGKWKVVVVGHLGPNRCLAEILEALALPEAANFTLAIIGDVAEQAPVDERIRELDLRARVRVHGFLPAAQMQRHLAEANLAINLRNPTMGEASASQLLLWDYGLPSLVSRTGWYGSLPEDSVCFAEPGREVEGVLGFFKEFLASPARMAGKGAAGRRLLEREHDPGRYARGLVALSREAIGWRAAAGHARALMHVAEVAASVGASPDDPLALCGASQALAELYQPPGV